MSEKLSVIADACENTIAKRDYVNNIKNDLQIKEYEFLTKGIDINDPNCLYIGMVSNLPPVLPDISFINLFVIKDEKLSKTYIDSDRVNIVLFPHSTDIFWLLYQVHKFFSTSEYVYKSIFELLDVASRTEGYKGIIGKAYEIFKNPIMVTDLSLNKVESNLGIGGATKDEFWQIALKPQFTEEDYFDDVIANEQDPNSPDKRDIFIWESNVMNHRMGVGKIKLGSEISGYIKMIESNRKISDSDLLILKGLADILSIKIRMGDVHGSNSDNQASVLIKAIISGRLTGEEKINKLLRNINISIKKYLYILCIEVRDKNKLLSMSNKELYKYLFQEIFNKDYFITYDDKIVILVDTNNDGAWIGSMLHSIEPALEKNGLILGYSNSFDNPANMRLYYEQACKAINVARKGRMAGNIFKYDDLVIEDMLDTFAVYDNLEALVHPAFKLLATAEESGNNELLITLREYLSNGYNIPKTANKLKVHYNTVKYRIGKIVEITNIDIEDPNVLLRLQLSLIAFDRINKYK